MCYDIVRAAQRELIDPSASLATLKPLFIDCRQTHLVSPTVLQSLGEHMHGASTLVDNQVSQQIVEEAMLQCLISGSCLSDAVAHVENEYAEREAAKQKRLEIISADPEAQQLYDGLINEVRAGNGAAIFGEGFRNSATDKIRWEQEQDDNDEDDDGQTETNDCFQDILFRDGGDDEEYSVARAQKCGCPICSAVSQTLAVWSTWTPQDAVDHEMRPIIVQMCSILFESAEDVIDDLLDGSDNDDEEDDDDDDDEDDSEDEEDCGPFSYFTQ